MVQVENLPYRFFVLSADIFFQSNRDCVLKGLDFRSMDRNSKEKNASLRGTVSNSALTTSLSTVENQIIVFKFDIKTWNWCVENTEL